MAKKLGDFICALLFFGLFASQPAHAYLDGGTVSLVLQAVAGAVASVLLFGKIYWTKLKGLFSRSNDGSPE